MANEFRVRNGIFSPNIGTESGDFTIDSAADVIIDADGADIILKDDGTEFGRFKRDSSDFVIKSATNNKDIIFKGNDGGSTITALTLDMSEAGAATFNDKITAVGTSVFTNLDISGDVDIDGTTNLDAVDIDGNVQLDGSLIVGADDTGYDVTFFGATSGAYMMWDASADDLILGGVARLQFDSADTFIRANTDNPEDLEIAADEDIHLQPDGDLHLDSGDFYGRSVNSAYSRLYKWGGIYFTWDSDTYGTNLDHSITSTENGTFADSITINSYDKIRLNMDANSNNTDSYIAFGRHSDGTANEIARFDDDGNFGHNCTDPESAIDIRGSAGSPGVLTLSTAETTVVDGDKIGQINFIAPKESSGTDAILAGASIYAEADATFTSSVNTTDLVFATNTSAAATARIRITSAGHFVPETNNVYDIGSDSLRFKDGYFDGDLDIDGSIDVDGTINFDILTGATGGSITGILDEDNFASNSNTHAATQQSIKAYVDSATSNSLPGDPNADRILIWDDSAGEAVWGVANNNLTISGTNINAATTGASVDDIWDVANIGNNGDLNSWIWNNQNNAADSGTISSALGNIAMGTGVLDVLTSGDYNYGIGHNAMGAITTASYNVAIGSIALNLLATDDYNTAVGYYAGEKTLGIGNTYVGASTGSSVSSASGDYNIGMGYDAADLISSGSKNICIGYQAGDNITTGSNNVIIGNVDSASGSGDDNLRIASGAGDVTWISGDSSGNLTMPADIAAVSLDISGDIDVDGTANLDNTDIDGTLDVSGIVSIASEIRHTGDTNNSIAFGTDTQTFETGGSTRIDISDSGVRFGGTGVRITSIENNDSLGTSDTKLCTQGNVKAYVDANAGGGGLSNIVEDTSPQLGGDLDTNSRNIIIDDAHGIYDENSNEQMIFQTVANATAYFQIWNGISDSTTATLFGTDVVTHDTAGGGRMTGPGIEATGSATDVGFTMRTKGLGQFVMMNDDTTTAAAPVLTLLRYHSSEADNDVLGLIKFVGPDSSMDNPGLEDHRDYAKIECNLIDSNTSSADGNLMFSALLANSHQDLMRLGAHEDDDDAAGVALYRGMMIDHGSNHTLTEADEAGCYIRATAAITLTLPASPAKGEQYVIISDHAGTTTISANGSDTMNGSTSNQTITTRYQAKTFIAVSTSAWIVIG